MTDNTNTTKDDLLERRRARREESDTEDSDLVQLLTPESRFRTLDALLSVAGDAMTERNVAEQAGISQSSANRHLKALITEDLVQQVEKVGNARRYRANTGHPLVQLLAMADNIIRFGRTPSILDEHWVGDPEYEPGDHPNDPRGE